MPSVGKEEVASAEEAAGLLLCWRGVKDTASSLAWCRQGASSRPPLPGEAGGITEGSTRDSMLPDPYTLHSSQILSPGSRPEQVAAHLVALGYTDGGGHPEGYRFDFQGWKPQIWLRARDGLLVLELGEADPQERSRILQGLPLWAPAAVRAVLRGRDLRDQPLALSAVELWEDDSFLPEVEALCAEVGRVGDRAGATRAALEQSLKLRQVALGAAMTIGAELRPLLMSLPTGRCPTELRPGLLDSLELVDPALSGPLSLEISRHWDQGPTVGPQEPGFELDVWVSPAGMLRGPNALSRPFPLGYRDIAGWLLPSRTWVCWRYRAPGATRGSLYDGLVRVQGRWLWVPKPWKLFPEVLATAREGRV